MKELIKTTLTATLASIEGMVPLTKKKCVEVDIDNVKPRDLPLFMQKNGVPNTAHFSTRTEQGVCCIPILCYEIAIPTTAEDRCQFIERRFNGGRAF